MPKDLFAPARPERRSSRGWTLIGSLILHGTLLIMLVSASLSAALDGPSLMRRVDRFIVAATPPELPPVPAPQRVPEQIELPNPNLAPLTAPVGLAPEVEMPATSVGIPQSFGVIANGLPATIGTGAATLSAPPPPVAEIKRVGGDIRAPQRLVYVPPVYPAIALSAKAEGIVILEATLDETGAVRDLKVIKSHPLFDHAAIDAVQKWRYSPTRLNGVPVPIIMSITVRFALQ